MAIVNPPLIAIIGPTASGKSELAVKLAKSFRGAVISADSQQVYKGAAIGTNQPRGAKKTMLGMPAVIVQGVPHFFIGALSPASQYSAAKFQTQAKSLIGKLWNKGYVPILVGGTGLYVSAITEDYRFPAGGSDRGLRSRLAKKTLPQLLRELKRMDPSTFQRIDKNNERRVSRALEHVLTSGGSFFNSQHKEPRAKTLVLGIRADKSKLMLAIQRRTGAMFRRGLLAEAKRLKQNHPGAPLLGSIGYREALGVLKGKISPAEAKKLISTRTWQYAKRQTTWFKRMPQVRWITSHTEAQKLARDFLAKKP